MSAGHDICGASISKSVSLVNVFWKIQFLEDTVLFAYL